MATEFSPRVVRVATQNVLLDVGRTKSGQILPQDQRIPELANALGYFDIPFDVVGIQEAHEDNGEKLARLCGYEPGVWQQHNKPLYKGAAKGRNNEYVGLMGKEVKEATPLELGDRRTALMTVIGETAFVALHLRAGRDAWLKRGEQAAHLVRQLEDYENTVLLGDFNEIPLPVVARGRQVLRSAGFHSVFSDLWHSHPKTFPVPSYKGITGGDMELSLDDIMIRGPRVKVLVAGVLPRAILPDVPPGMPADATDHFGLWARLEISK